MLLSEHVTAWMAVGFAGSLLELTRSFSTPSDLEIHIAGTGSGGQRTEPCFLVMKWPTY
jgi:hypothetical protein